MDGGCLGRVDRQRDGVLRQEGRAVRGGRRVKTSRTTLIGKWFGAMVTP